jgi:DNA-binding MarR family transcriptional regulator
MDDLDARLPPILTDADYERLAELRYSLRGFLHWSAQRAREAGITPTQHQLLLTIRSSRTPRGATIREVAEVLLIRHHSAVGLVDRAQEAGLITRERDPEQQSVVHLKLTEWGAVTVSSLSAVHLRELTQLAPTMQALLAALTEGEAARLKLFRT